MQIRNATATLGEINSELLHEVLAVCPHPRSLAVNVHRDGREEESKLDASDGEEDLLRTIILEPVVEEEREDESVEDVLGEIQRHETFPRVHAVGVDGEGDRGGRTQGATEADNAEEDGRHDPVILLLRAPAEPHETDASGDGYGDRHNQAELGLVDAAVLAAHRLDDDIADLSSYRGAEDAANERRNVDQTDPHRGEVIVIAAIDGRDRLRKHNEPSNTERINQSAPQDGRVSE